MVGYVYKLQMAAVRAVVLARTVEFHDIAQCLQVWRVRLLELTSDARSPHVPALAMMEVPPFVPAQLQ